MFEIPTCPECRMSDTNPRCDSESPPLKKKYPLMLGSDRNSKAAREPVTSIAQDNFLDPVCPTMTKVTKGPAMAVARRNQK
jgi:hypothetical protein